MHLAPGFPTLSKDAVDLVVVFYVRYPSDLQSDNIVVPKVAISTEITVMITVYNRYNNYG